MNNNQINRNWFYAFLAVAVFFLAGCDETMRVSYATAAAARADGAIQRGWLPQELPDSATEIAESHDLDTNTGSGSFRFEKSDADLFRAKLQPVLPAQVQLFRDPERFQRGGYTFYAVPGFVLAINWQERHAHFVLNSHNK